MMRAGLAWLLFGGAFVFSAAAFGLSTQVDSLPSLMSRDDLAVARHAIAVDTRAAFGRCRAVEAPRERSRCRVQARAEDRVKRAELAARYYGTVAASREAQQARVRASYDVAKAECADRTGRERSSCILAARKLQSRGTELAAGPT